MQKHIFKVILISILIATCSLYSYAQTSFSGTYYIGGSNPDYATITAAINDLKATTSVVTGPVILKIRPGIYQESVNIPAINGTSAANPLTITSETGKASDVIIQNPDMNTKVTFSTGCNNITLDHLTIENFASKASAALLINGNLSTNGRSTTVQNCVIRVDNESLTAHSSGINVIQGPFDLKILNNEISGGEYNILVEGATYVVPGLNRAANFIKGNRMTEAYRGCILKIFDYDYYIQSNYIRLREGNEKRIYAEGVRTNNSRGMDVIANNFFAGGFKNCINGTVITGELSIQGMMRIINNTIVYDGDSTGISYLCYVTGLHMAEIYNNVLINKAKGKLIYLYPRKFEEILANSDRNIFYTEGPAFGEFNAIPCSSFAQWQSVSLRDQNSKFFKANLVSDLDLHSLDPRLEGLALPDSTALDDYDYEVRDLNTPDIGADEFTIPAVDLALREPRLISFPDDPVKKKITVTLRNEGMQSLQGKILNLSYSLDGGTTWSAAQSVTLNDMDQLFKSQSVTFDQTAVLANGGSYLVCIRNNTPVALDNNLQNDQTCLEYCRVVEKIVYEVGGMPSDFNNLQDAADFLNNLDCDLDYPVVLDIKPGTYTGAVRIGKIRGASSTNTITLRSATGNSSDVRIISSTDSTGGGATVLLDDASFIRLENLTIENTAIGAGFGTYGYGIFIRGYNAADNLIRNCRVKMDSIIQFDVGNSAAIVDSAARKNVIIDNVTSGGECGIIVYGSMKPDQRDNVILGNTVRQAYITGIMAHQAAFTMVDKNTISLRNDNDETQGIYLKNIIADLTVDGNRISNVGSFGILLESSQSVNKGIRLSNNMISGSFHNIIAGAGIRVDGTSKTEVVYNSVNCLAGGTEPVNAFESHASQIWVLKNNIFRNESGGHAYYIDELVNLLESDYNDLYRTDNAPEICYLQGAKTLIGLNNEGFDTHSLSIDPQFNSADDLHLFNQLLNGKGVPLADLTRDIDGETRDTQFPDIGADEFNIGIDGALNAITLSDPDPQPGAAQTVSVQISNPGNTSISNFPLSYQVGTAMPVTETFSGTLAAGGNASYTFTTTWTPAQNGTYDICGTIAVNNDINLLNDQTCASFTTDNSNGTVQLTGQSLRIYPNPVQQYIFIELPDQEPAIAELYDLPGKQVHAQASGAGVMQVDLSGLAEGIYLLKVSGTNFLHWSRIVKQ